jgi:hypothetical protein
MLNELVHHHNRLEAIMVQLTQQHKELVDMIRKDRSLIVRHEQVWTVGKDSRGLIR